MQFERIAGFPDGSGPAIYWLGQAGFWIETGTHRLLIDPYLSDSLAKKYAGQRFPHQRMMPPPISIEDLPRPDLVLVTHAHTDHMDAATLGPLAKRFPDLSFVVPAAVVDVARGRIGDVRLIGMDAQEVVTIAKGLSVTAFAAAHEDRRVDAEGRHVFLGYGIESGGLRYYHSGDSIPFADLDAAVQEYAPHIALLPVNGRDATRASAGIPGNFTLEEAHHLARNCTFFVPHHFGMFSFNTIDPQQIDDPIATAKSGPVVLRPRTGEHLRFRK